MNEDEIIKRSVELAADCTADNAAGTLFYAAVFGGAGAMLYRTVSIIRRTYSTRSEKSDDFGRAAHDFWAFLDFIPSHITAAISSMSASMFGLDTEDCFRIFRRDRKNVVAANLAPCRCVFAGALGISLTPKSYLKDGVITFVNIGTEMHPCGYEDVAAANEVMYAASFFTMLLFAAVKLVITLAIVL